MMPLLNFCNLPPFLLALTILSFSITYCISVNLGHVAPICPFISDTGCKTPEKEMFSQFVNTLSFLMYCTVYLRYLLIEEVNATNILGDRRIPHWVNKASACIGGVSATGLSVLGNFAVCSVHIVHHIGYWFCGVFGIIYYCFQTYISKQMVPEVTSETIFKFRFSLMLLLLVTSSVTASCSKMAKQAFKGEDLLHWHFEDGGFKLHVASVYSQWLMILLGNIYFATYHWEFRNFELIHPVLKMKQEIPSADNTLLLIVSVYLRFYHVKCVVEAIEGCPFQRRSNIVSAVMGFLSGVGLSILTNFPKLALNFLHIFGVFVCFSCGLLYFIYQTHFSRELKPVLTTEKLYTCRLAIVILISILMAVEVVSGAIAQIPYHGENSLKWSKKDGGWYLHVLSTFSQWIVVILSNVFIATFTCDMRRSNFRICQTPTINSAGGRQVEMADKEEHKEAQSGKSSTLEVAKKNEPGKSSADRHSQKEEEERNSEKERKETQPSGSTVLEPAKKSDPEKPVRIPSRSEIPSGTQRRPKIQGIRKR